MTRELLQNVRVLDPVSKIDRTTDILITENQIAAIQENITEIPADTEVRDCRGLILEIGRAHV